MRQLGFIVLMLCSAHLAAESRTIAVEGGGRLEIPPDRLRIEFSIESRDQSSLDAARAAVDEASAQVVSALTALGIAETDITAPNFWARVQREHDGENCPQRDVPVAGRQFSVLAQDVKLYNPVLQALLKQGATEVTSVTGELKDIEASRREALKLAIADAKARSQFFAEGFEAKLGPVYKIGRRSTQDMMQLSERALLKSDAQPQNPYNFVPANVEVTGQIAVEYSLE